MSDCQKRVVISYGELRHKTLDIVYPAIFIDFQSGIEINLSGASLFLIRYKHDRFHGLTESGARCTRYYNDSRLLDIGKGFSLIRGIVAVFVKSDGLEFIGSNDFNYQDVTEKIKTAIGRIFGEGIIFSESEKITVFRNFHE